MIQSLAYVGFTSPNADEWTTFGPDVLGLEVAPAARDGAVRLRIDDAAWRLAIHPGDTDDLAYIGWAVDGPDGLAAAVGQLTVAGIEVHLGDGDLADARSVAGIAWFPDPFGFRQEIGHGDWSRRERRPRTSRARAATGARA